MWRPFAAPAHRRSSRIAGPARSACRPPARDTRPRIVDGMRSTVPANSVRAGSNPFAAASARRVRWKRTRDPRQGVACADAIAGLRAGRRRPGDEDEHRDRCHEESTSQAADEFDTAAHRPLTRTSGGQSPRPEPGGVPRAIADLQVFLERPRWILNRRPAAMSPPERRRAGATAQAFHWYTQRASGGTAVTLAGSPLTMVCHWLTSTRCSRASRRAVPRTASPSNSR